MFLVMAIMITNNSEHVYSAIYVPKNSSVLQTLTYHSEWLAFDLR